MHSEAVHSWSTFHPMIQTWAALPEGSSTFLPEYFPNTVYDAIVGSLALSCHNLQPCLDHIHWRCKVGCRGTWKCSSQKTRFMQVQPSRTPVFKTKHPIKISTWQHMTATEIQSCIMYSQSDQVTPSWGQGQTHSITRSAPTQNYGQKTSL